MKEVNMKKLSIVITLILSTVFVYAAEFIHPLDFKDTEKERQKVIKYIESVVKETYSKIGMDDPSTLRMMEKEHLDCFKKLTEVTDRALLDRVIKTYCNVGMCDYSTIWMMYQEESKASKEKLSW
jgi:hypothetical protein